MQLRVLKISNIGPFPYVSNLNQIEGIRFHTSQAGVTNIIIGPNGSGKSTILEVINQVFKAGIQRDYVYEKEKMPQEKVKGDVQKGGVKNTFSAGTLGNQSEFPIRHIPHTFDNLQKHFAFLDKPSAVYLEFELFPKDKEYLRFVATHAEDLNRIIRTYSNCDVCFDFIDPREFDAIKTFGIYCIFDFTRREILVRRKNMNPVRKFLLDYLRHNELIQICIHIHNRYEVEVAFSNENDRQDAKGGGNGKDERASFYGIKSNKHNDSNENSENFDEKRVTSYWPEIKSSFAILGSNRVFSHKFSHERSYTDVELDQRITHADTKKSSVGELGYLLCRKRFRSIVRKAGGDVNALFAHPMFMQIQEILERYTGLTLDVKYQNDKIFIACRSKQGYVFELDQISSGEKSFLLLLLAVFGYDLYNGLMVIDEPELHLHPQIQQAFVTLIEYLEETFCLQFIIATHAPFFITPRTISHVIRCIKSNGNTFVYNCQYALQTSEANLIHILTYSNSAKIFFVEKIIMVEGETDEYFWRYYLEYIKKKTGKRDVFSNYEIVNIGGKGSFKKRKFFLKKFGINAYYIGDWDNILESVGDTSIYQYKKVILEKRRQEKEAENIFTHNFSQGVGENSSLMLSKERKHPLGILKGFDAFRKTPSSSFFAKSEKIHVYAELIAYLHDHHYETRKHLMSKIQELRTDNVFLLAHGDLESYLGLKQKGLEPTIIFCKSNFENRLHDPAFEKQRKDLENIVSCIFGSF